MGSEVGLWALLKRTTSFSEEHAPEEEGMDTKNSVNSSFCYLIITDGHIRILWLIIIHQTRRSPGVITCKVNAKCICASLKSSQKHFINVKTR